MMKKATPILCCILILAAMTVTGFAGESVPNRVFADQLNGAAGEEIIIPVKISGNTGFMGFGLSVSYDPAVLTPVSAALSESLSGIFDDSIETAEAGTYKIIYTSTESYTADGELFTLVFHAADDAAGQTVVRVSYVQDDTFDEEFHDVVLNCEPITVSFPSEDPPAAKLSEKIQSWAAGLRAPFDRVMSFLVKPIVFILSLLGR